MGVYVEALDGKGLLIPRVWSFITKQDLDNVSQVSGEPMSSAHSLFLLWHATELQKTMNKVG
jgi:hypothetical protein